MVEDKAGTVIGGNGCYGGKFIILINNRHAVNPDFQELMDFLKNDRTDAFPYHFLLPIPLPYWGDPEDNVDLERIKDIIDGELLPGDPARCGDFAERLHNNAELAGIRCGYVLVDLEDSLLHACNVFETTDRGLVYIDVTGTVEKHGPKRKDTIVDLEIGKQYSQEYVWEGDWWWIPSGELVTDITIIWDGFWRGTD